VLVRSDANTCQFERKIVGQVLNHFPPGATLEDDEIEIDPALSRQIRNWHYLLCDPSHWSIGLQAAGLFKHYYLDD
jgi:hypothetical protein